jgi:hypothetical protein
MEINIAMSMEYVGFTLLNPFRVFSFELEYTPGFAGGYSHIATFVALLPLARIYNPCFLLRSVANRAFCNTQVAGADL